jgi:release factor glutamine methyltransferase
VISVTVAAEYDKVEITAADISEKALQVAQKNAAAFGVSKKISFVCSDLFAALDPENKFDLILSNPPYISDGEYDTLPPEVLADPKISLVSGVEGMDIIDRIIKSAPDYLAEGGAVMFEIGYDQSEKVARLVEADGRYKSYTIMKDLNDINRMAYLKY